jgi:rhodanese-related sulfurtransferase
MIEDISVIRLKQRMDAGETLHLIDVREGFEYEEFHLGGTLIPLGELPSRIDELEHLKEEEIIVHCRSGKRSYTAQQFLLQNGFKNVRNLIGGVLDWQAQFES